MKISAIKTGLSQHMESIGNSPTWDDVRIIYRESNCKKRKFKEAARIASHYKGQLINEKLEERKFSICGT